MRRWLEAVRKKVSLLPRLFIFRRTVMVASIGSLTWVGGVFVGGGGGLVFGVGEAGCVVGWYVGVPQLWQNL